MNNGMKKSLGEQPAFPWSWDQVGGMTIRQVVAIKVMASLVLTMQDKGPMAIVARTMALTEQLLSELSMGSYLHQNDYQDNPIVHADRNGEPLPEVDLPF